MIENEFKVMLTEGQYERVLALYDFVTFTQINHYYDTADLEMSARRVTVRVRAVDGKFFLQMKLPTAALFSRVELSKELPNLPEKISGAELSALSGTDCPDVERLGELKTTRSIYKFNGGEIDVDRSEYFGKTDYELEIEFTDEQAARRVLAEITEKTGIENSGEVCVGKVRRFLDEYAGGKQ